MDIKKEISSLFGEDTNVNKVRLRYTKFIFMFLSLVFFSSYFFFISGFYSKTFLLIFKYSYPLFSLSLFLLIIFYYLNNFGNKNKIYSLVFIGIMIFLYLLSILVFLFPKLLNS